MSLGDVVMTIYVLFCMGCFFALGRISMRFGGACRRGFDEGWDKGWEACARTNAALVTAFTGSTAWRISCGRWASEPMCRKNIHTR